MGSILAAIFQIYSFVIVVWVVASWIPQLQRHRAMTYVGRMVEPVLAPLQRAIPPIGGLDISPVVAIIALQLLAKLALRLPF